MSNTGIFRKGIKMKRFRKIFITVVAMLLLFSSLVYCDIWTADKRLTDTSGTSMFPAIVVNGSNIYVVWQDQTPGNYEIYFKRSIDGGGTWSANKRLTNTAGFSVGPAIAVYGSNIYVVWQDDTPAPGYPEIYFKRSIDGGGTWSANKRLTNNAGISNYPAIAAEGSNIYVVWEDRTPGNPEIYFKRSVDGGATWAAAKRLTNSAGNSSSPGIAVDASNIYVVWTYWTFTAGNDEIYFKRSIDGGATWSANKRLTNNAGISNYPAIAAEGSNIYVVWKDETPENDEIYFKRSVDGGATWAANKRLTNNAGISNYPTIATDILNIYVVWHDNTAGNYEIYFKRSVDGGATWAANKRLTNNAGISNYPAIAAEGSNIYVVWEDNRDYTPGNSEIYLKKGVID
jgi:hypothetical protein